MFLLDSSPNLQLRKPYDHHHGFSQKNHITREPVTSPFTTKSLSDRKYHAPASLSQAWRGHKNRSTSSAVQSKGINFSVITRFHPVE